jgi:hypothetical protein
MCRSLSMSRNEERSTTEVTENTEATRSKERTPDRFYPVNTVRFVVIFRWHL